MISIKQFLETSRNSPPPKHDLLDALTQMGRLLLDAVAAYMVRGTDADLEDFRRKINRLVRQMDAPQSAMSVLSITTRWKPWRPIANVLPSSIGNSARSGSRCSRC